jgi:hypothetical protein
MVALGTEPRSEGLGVHREPDIRSERGFARHHDVIVTEAYDESDGTSRVRHAGEDPALHQVLLVERGQLQRHRVTEEQRSRRLLAWLASTLLLGAAVILAFAPESTNVLIGAALLLAAAGAFGVKAFRIKVKDFELDVGERTAAPANQLASASADGVRGKSRDKARKPT